MGGGEASAVELDRGKKRARQMHGQPGFLTSDAADLGLVTQAALHLRLGFFRLGLMEPSYQ